MCLLFLYLGNWAKQSYSSSNKFYKLILAMNRDERHSIRTAAAKFWQEPDSHILAGLDLKTHGAWLGISKYGKLGASLRIRGEVNPAVAEEARNARLSPNPANNFISRGSLVPSFLESWSPLTATRSDTNTHLILPPKLSGLDFANKLCQGPEHRSILRKIFPFHLLTVDLLPDPSSRSALVATYLSTATTPDPNAHTVPRDVTPPLNTCDFLAYGNSSSYKPFQKVIIGRQEFMDLVTNHTCTESGAVRANEENKTSLRDTLLEFLRCTRKHLPDPVLHDFAKSSRIKEKVMYKLSSRFVRDFYDNGTRVISILLVDTDNNVTFFDWYLERPVYNPLEHGQWEESTHEFKLSA